MDSPELGGRPPAPCLPGPVPAWPAGGPGPVVRVAVFYDGVWFQNAARYFAYTRGGLLLVGGLHDAIRWHAAGVFGCPAGQVAISHAHYIAGRDPGAGPSGWDQILADHGITRHDVPVTTADGEVGAGVEFALICYQIAVEASPDMIVLLTGDGGFAPLAVRLVRRGARVLVPVANLSYPADTKTVEVLTSSILTRRATDTPSLADLIDAAHASGYPPHLRCPLEPGTADPGAGARPDGGGPYTGTVTCREPGSLHGPVASSSGQSWFASEGQPLGRQPIAPGTPVTITTARTSGTSPDSTIPDRADIIHDTAGSDGPSAAGHAGASALAETTPPAAAPSHAGAPGDSARKSHWLSVIDSAALARLRHQAGWSRGELARRSGVSVTTINRLEQNDLNCHVRTASLVAAALGKPPAAITRPSEPPRLTAGEPPSGFGPAANWPRPSRSGPY